MGNRSGILTFSLLDFTRDSFIKLFLIGLFGASCWSPLVHK